MNLTRNNWQLGWLPSDDEYNGRKVGLARMDNLQLDENGNIALVHAYNKINTAPFAGYPHTIYSKYISDTKYRFVALSDGSVICSSDDFTTSTTILTGGHVSLAAFESTYGQVLVCSGTKHKKYDGTNNYDLGVETPTSLTNTNLSVATHPFINVENLDGGGSYTNWTLEVGANLVNNSDYVQFDTDPDTLIGTVETVYTSYPKDTTILSDGSIGSGDDLFNFWIRVSDPTKLDWINIVFIADSNLSNESSFYHYTWVNIDEEGNRFYTEPDSWLRVEIKRNEFGAVLGTPNKDWTDIGRLKLSVAGQEQLTIVANSFRFDGGTKGPLTGKYYYAQQNVYNSGATLHKSKLSTKADYPIEVESSYVIVTPNVPTDPQVNEIWIYRRSADVNIDVTPIGEQPKLDVWYRVGVMTTPFTYLDDQLSDEDALITNIKGNENLISVADIPDAILGIITNYFERTLYMTFKEIYLSEPRNPDAVDNSITIKLSGDATEKNLWIRKVQEGLLYIGTTHDIYSISGTLETQPDDTIDAFIKSFGTKFPPFGWDVAVDNGTVFYLTSDGWRGFTGSQNLLISEQLDLVFKNETRYTKAPVTLTPNGNIVYPCCISRGKLFASSYSQDGTRPIFVYDYSNQAGGRPNYWYYYNTNPICLFTEEDGKIIAGYGDAGDYYLRELDVGSLVDESGYLSIYFQTFYDDNEQPRNRKDTFTFKFTADTGGRDLTLQVSKDGADWETVGTYTCTGKTEHLIKFHTYTLGFRYAFRFYGSFSTFKLYNFTLEYDPRPEQLNYLRIQHTNLGTISRKRFTNYAFSIDTLGNDISFTPYIDGIPLTGSTVNINYQSRGTYIHYFTEETIGTDIGGILECNIFEFYGLDLEEIISEKLPTPVKFLIIPANDYGTPNRKRHSSYKFAIHTRGKNVQFTPKLDGVAKTAVTYNTSEKRVVEYFFTQDTIAIDIGGTLETLENTPFEFYGVIVPQDIEVLPPRLKEFWIPETNYNVAAKKRIRTIPMMINTNGYDVTFTPQIDKVAGTPSTINTPSKQTAFHYFTTDIFGVDFAGELVGSQPFEFYGLLKPEQVEVIPVGKKFDQIGPVHLSKIGKIVRFRIRLIPTGTSLSYAIYAEDSSIYSGSIITTANIDSVYEVCVPKSKHATICRIEFSSSNVFHRYYVDMDFNLGGNSTDIKRIRVGSDPNIT